MYAYFNHLKKRSGANKQNANGEIYGQVKNATLFDFLGGNCQVNFGMTDYEVQEEALQEGTNPY